MLVHYGHILLLQDGVRVSPTGGGNAAEYALVHLFSPQLPPEGKEDGVFFTIPVGWLL